MDRGPHERTFVTGANTVTLNFHQTVDANINPNFDNTQPLVVRDGSQVRISRNGEDIAGPNFALDGWEVKRVTLPPRRSRRPSSSASKAKACPTRRAAWRARPTAASSSSSPR